MLKKYYTLFFVVLSLAVVQSAFACDDNRLREVAAMAAGAGKSAAIDDCVEQHSASLQSAQSELRDIQNETGGDAADRASRYMAIVSLRSSIRSYESLIRRFEDLR